MIGVLVVVLTVVIMVAVVMVAVAGEISSVCVKVRVMVRRGRIIGGPRRRGRM